jgi:hypothetical protein
MIYGKVFKKFSGEKIAVNQVFQSQVKSDSWNTTVSA